MLRYGRESLPDVNVLRVGPHDAVLPAHPHRLGLQVDANVDVRLCGARGIIFGLPLLLAEHAAS